MSQSPNPTDTQVLLQSMLQRLKLQPGREGQAYLHSPVSITAASTQGQGGDSGVVSLKKANNSPVSEVGTNGISSKEVTLDKNCVLSGGEIQQVGPGCGVDTGLTSLPSQKDNSGDTGVNRVVEQATQPVITPTGTQQLFPTKSLKDADITSFERTDVESVSFGSSTPTKDISPNTNSVSSMGPNQNQDPDQGFSPKVYTWSLKNSDVDTGGQDNKVFHMGNGGLEEQSKDMQIVSANSSFRRKQRSSENKTRRWTQKIKERWKDRSGSFGKKGKERGETGDQRSDKETDISSPSQVLTTENLNTSSNDGERTLPSLDSSDPSKTLPSHTEESTVDGHIRSTSDFEFGLGSFSLLEEIVMGQEWAKFLNPNLSATLANQRAPEEQQSRPVIHPNPYDSNQPSGPLNQLGGGSNQWSFRSTESSPSADFSMAQISPDAFSAVSMDVTEGKQPQQSVQREADQSEPMEDGCNQTVVQSGESTQRPQPAPPSFVGPADILQNSMLKSRVSLNRKRQHQPAERREDGGEEANRERSISSQSLSSSHVMDETGGSQQDNIIPLYNLHPTPQSSSSSFRPPLRGVLKHSISHESSMETVTKKRRVEENRRVHFSEEVVTIPSPDLDLDVTDSEDDSGADEDSVIDEECEMERGAMEEVAPARRAALPAWIQALKRRNTGRKHR